jgi:hypothetical protein
LPCFPLFVVPRRTGRSRRATHARVREPAVGRAAPASLGANTAEDQERERERASGVRAELMPRGPVVARGAGAARDSQDPAGAGRRASELSAPSTRPSSRSPLLISPAASLLWTARQRGPARPGPVQVRSQPNRRGFPSKTTNGCAGRRDRARNRSSCACEPSSLEQGG